MMVTVGVQGITVVPVYVVIVCTFRVIPSTVTDVQMLAPVDAGGMFKLVTVMLEDVIALLNKKVAPS